MNYFSLEQINKIDVEGIPKIQCIDNIEVSHVIQYANQRIEEYHQKKTFTFTFAIFKIIVMTILQIALYYDIIAVFVPTIIIITLLFIIHLSQWITTLFNNTRLLKKMDNSIILTSPIKNILYVVCFHILHIIIYHVWIILYCIMDINILFQHKIIIYVATIILHCVISLFAIFCENKFYMHFEMIILQQITVV